jgi:hypothetical protein
MLPNTQTNGGGELPVNHTWPYWMRTAPKTIAKMLRTRPDVDNSRLDSYS